MVSTSPTTVSRTIGLRSVELTFWGVPGGPQPRRDARKDLRQPYMETKAAGLRIDSPGGEPSDLPPVAFDSMPTDCSAGPQSFTQTADSWQEPGVYTDKTEVFPAVTGCNLLAFNAGYRYRRGTRYAGRG